MMLTTGAAFRTRSDLQRWSKFAKNIITGYLMLNQDFREFIQSLNDNQVRYLVVGGYAVALHGYPRYTKDGEINAWKEKSRESQGKPSIKIDRNGYLD